MSAKIARGLFLKFLTYTGTTLARINIERGLELSKYLVTPAGQQLAGALQFLTTLGDLVISALRKNLTFKDNIDSKFQEVELLTGTESIANVDTDAGIKKAVRGIWPVQVLSTAYGIDKFHWYVDGSGLTKVKVDFSGSPAATLRIKVVLLIIYG